MYAVINIGLSNTSNYWPLEAYQFGVHVSLNESSQSDVRDIKEHNFT